LLNYLPREIGVALHQRRDGVGDLPLDQAAHLEEAVLKSPQFLFILPIGMLYLSSTHLASPGTLAEAPGDVIFGLAARRVGKDLVGIAEFDEVAGVEERGRVGGSRRLLHIMSDYYYCVVRLQLE